MILQLSLLATVALLLVAICPTTGTRPRDDAAPRSGSRALMRGIVRTICPTCCEIVDADGLTTTIAMKAETLIAGEPASGDRVDVLAEFTGSSYRAVSIVRTAR